MASSIAGKKKKKSKRKANGTVAGSNAETPTDETIGQKEEHDDEDDEDDTASPMPVVSVGCTLASWTR